MAARTTRSTLKAQGAGAREVASDAKQGTKRTRDKARNIDDDDAAIEEEKRELPASKDAGTGRSIQKLSDQQLEQGSASKDKGEEKQAGVFADAPSQLN